MPDNDMLVPNKAWPVAPKPEEGSQFSFSNHSIFWHGYFLFKLFHSFNGSEVNALLTAQLVAACRPQAVQSNEAVTPFGTKCSLFSFCGVKK